MDVSQNMSAKKTKKNEMHIYDCHNEDDNNFDMNCNSSHASSSYLSPVSHEVRSGSFFYLFLPDLLLHNYLSGITVSSFITNLHTLQISPSLYGIVVHGLSHEEYKDILLRHIFGGVCVQGPNKNVRSACRPFAQHFASPSEMTQFAFDIISSANSSQRCTD